MYFYNNNNLILLFTFYFLLEFDKNNYWCKTTGNFLPINSNPGFDTYSYIKKDVSNKHLAFTKCIF